MSFIKKLRLSKRLPSALTKSLNKQPPNNAVAGVGAHPQLMAPPLPNGTTLSGDEAMGGGTADTTLDESMNATHSHALTTLNTTNTTSGSSKKSGGKHKPGDSRCLVIYHIDSETEGTLSITVRVIGCINFFSFF